MPYTLVDRAAIYPEATYPTLGALLTALSDAPESPELARRRFDAKFEVHNLGTTPAPVLRTYNRAGPDLAGIADLAAFIRQEITALAEARRKPDGSMRGPAEMTRRDWEAVVAIHNLAYGVVPGLTPQQRAAQYDWGGEGLNIESYVERLLQAAFGYGPHGRALPAANGSKILNGRHDLHCIQWLCSGRALPPEVEADCLSRGHRWEPVFEPLLRNPFLRGRFKSPHLLQNVMSALGPVAITEGNVESIAAAVSELDSDALHHVIDDALYEAGLVHDFPVKAAVARN